MTTSERRDPTIRDLLTMIEQQRVAMEELQAELHRRTSVPQLAAMETLPASRMKKRRGGDHVAGPLRRPSSFVRRVHERVTQMSVGVSLALVLLVAPGGSAVTHAANEGVSNTAYGTGALPGDTGSQNAAFGVDALHSNTAGYHNTASGFDSLYTNSTGAYNSAFGGSALQYNTTGITNTASGSYSLRSNTSGNENTASGSFALTYNTIGSDNTASGLNALQVNTTGNNNTASGAYALTSNTTAANNTASGYDALYNNITGGNNTASGSYALQYNTTGANNTASGNYALNANSTGANNTAVGTGAGYTDTPVNGNTTGSNNTFIGYNSGPGTSSEITNATAIGANAVVSQSNAIVLGGIGDKTQRVGVGTTTPHSAFQIAKGFLQLRPITGSEPAAAQCVTADDAGRLVVRTDGTINLYVCTGTGGWIGK